MPPSVDVVAAAATEAIPDSMKSLRSTFRVYPRDILKKTPAVRTMSELKYQSRNGIVVTRTLSRTDFHRGLKPLLRRLDTQRGIYLSSGYEYPERYSRWDIGSVCPPLEILSWGRQIEFRALNQRGQVLLAMLRPVLQRHPHWEDFTPDETRIAGRLKALPKLFPEEDRSKQPSVFSILRALCQEFENPQETRLGLVGAFGYDLLFQFDPIEFRLPRENTKDLHLFLCDDIYYMDRKKEQIERYRFDFTREGLSTEGLPRDGEKLPRPKKTSAPDEIVADHTPAGIHGKCRIRAPGHAAG